MVKLSIITPLYNSEDLIIRALDSIPKRKDIEIIIIDDASTDNSLNIVKKWKDDNFVIFNNILIIENEQNSGPGVSKGKAFKVAKGEYICGLDSDDYYLTESFNNLINMLDNFNKYDIIRYDNELNNGSIEHEKHTSTWSYILKNRFKSIEYPANITGEDWYYWLKILQADAKILSTNNLCYHYNSPREGSLVWKVKNGILPKE